MRQRALVFSNAGRQLKLRGLCMSTYGARAVFKIRTDLQGKMLHTPSIFICLDFPFSKLLIIRNLCHAFFFISGIFSCCARRRIELATTGGYTKNSKKICSRTQCSIVCAKNVTCWTPIEDSERPSLNQLATTPIYMLSREQSSGLQSA